MTWFVIHLRNGKNVLVDGDVARDRAMARKTPKAVSWGRPRIHQCSVCRARGPWVGEQWDRNLQGPAGWCWVGTARNARRGRNVEKFCSHRCRIQRYPQYPESDCAVHFEDRVTLQGWEPILDKHRWNCWSSSREREQAFKAHRRFEMPVHANRGNGWCRWCGLEIRDRKGKNKGKRSKIRTWCRHRQGDLRDCWREYLLHTDSEVQWRYLAKRDGIGCADCGKQDGKWVAAGQSYHDEKHWRGITSIGWSIRLEVDHDIPLWRIPELPADKPEWRQALFGPDNLKLRCGPCHTAKSAREAAERAAMRE